jgi:hypothetical protein
VEIGVVEGAVATAGEQSAYLSQAAGVDGRRLFDEVGHLEQVVAHVAHTIDQHEHVPPADGIGFR